VLLSVLSLAESTASITSWLKAASSTAASSPHDALRAESRTSRHALHTRETGRHCSPSGTGGITPARSRRAAARRHGAYAPLAVATLRVARLACEGGSRLRRGTLARLIGELRAGFRAGAAILSQKRSLTAMPRNCSASRAESAEEARAAGVSSAGRRARREGS
jgi:hypothetical protein